MGSSGSNYRLKKKNTKIGNNLQSLWEYIRRKQMFRLGDAAMVVNLKPNTLNPYLLRLENTGYLRLITPPKPTNDRHYILIKDTGLQAPTANNGFLYDYNTKEELRIPRREEVFELELLRAMSHEALTTKVKILKNLHIIRPEKAKVVLFSQFVKAGYMTRISPFKRIDGELAFSIDIEKVKEKITNIEETIYRPRSEDV